MTSPALLEDAFGRIRETVGEVLADLSPGDLSQRLDDDANPIVWLIWHLTRTQDDHIAGVAGTGQVWVTDGWSERFGLPLDDGDIGYGHDSAQVAAVVASGELLAGYHEAVAGATLRYVRSLADADLDRIVDEHWDPPVTLSVRLVSVIADNLQHAGQAAYVKGILARR
jgi:hypothetical protein